MSYIDFTKTELAAAIARGVRQCVMIASRPPLREALNTSPNSTVQVFAVDEDVVANSSATFVPTKFASETLAAALEKTDFDRMKASLFVWLGGAGYRALDGVMASLAFIASLPKGSGVVFDYASESTSSKRRTDTALDALASRISLACGNVKHVIQPQAVTAMLHCLGFRQIVEVVNNEFQMSPGHLVSAVV
jgi:O-methyltransferase involved in polyketide biosynthesis